MTTVKELLEQNDFFDESIMRHGFTDYMRDYELIVQFSGPHANVIKKYQFVGCVEADYSSALPSAGAHSLADEFVLVDLDSPPEDFPAGFIWAVRYANVYPGWAYIENGERAEHWSKLLGRKMHEIDIKTNVFNLKLVFADIRIAEMSPDSQSISLHDMPLPIQIVTSDGGVA